MKTITGITLQTAQKYWGGCELKAGEHVITTHAYMSLNRQVFGKGSTKQEAIEDAQQTINAIGTSMKMKDCLHFQIPA